MGKVSLKVYEKILEEKIKMKPAGYFKCCNIAWTLMTGSLLLLASFLFSLIFNYFLNLRIWRSFSQTAQDGVFFIASLPYVLIIVFSGLIYLASKFYWKGRVVIKQEQWEVISIFILIAVFLGVVFTSTNYASAVYEKFRVMKYLNVLFSKMP